MYPNTQGYIWKKWHGREEHGGPYRKQVEQKSEMHLCSKKPNILGCIRQKADGGSSFPTLSTAETPSASLCTILASWIQDRYRHTRARPMKAIKGLECFPYKRLKALQLFSLEKRTIREDLCVYKYPMGGCKESEPDSS